ncbi:hypothetical protein VTJ83DRAFT_5591 [Remersonia thermophila]|uniref:Uncharacterized protein n=1 Tax=Remersonia thermophila TaxID=72144 RepID=A0ABR4D882_9PEZI
MPQDPHLYGQPRPKRQKKEIAISGSLAFASELSSLLAESTSAPPAAPASSSSSTAVSTGRTRPSKLKTDDLSNTKIRRSKDPSSTSAARSQQLEQPGKLSLKSPLGTEESKAERDFIRRKMESKARLYAAMQRGDYIGREFGLVDFDRKWAESQAQKKQKATSDGAPACDSDPDSDSDSDPDAETDAPLDTALHEYTDEFGRVRLLTRAQIARLERRAASAAELARMSARPKAPEELIRGDAVQVEAFSARDGEDAMEALARKRDRSPTPPDPEHYRADREIRTKGVGFYKFSVEEEKRMEEMRALEEERRRTEEVRKEREEAAKRRKEEIEKRKKEILEKRAKKMADSFLEGLGKDLVGGGGDEGGAG